MQNRRTNCDNCGAVLVNGKCKHCGSVWFKEGFTIGEHGVVTSAKFEVLGGRIETTCYGDRYANFIVGRQEYNVSLDICGLTAQEMKDLYELIYSGFPKLHSRKDG